MRLGLGGDGLQGERGPGVEPKLSLFESRNGRLRDAKHGSQVSLRKVAVFAKGGNIHSEHAYMRIRMVRSMNLCVRGYAPPHSARYGAPMDRAFGRRVFEIRKQAKLGQTEFGELFDVSQSTVGRWERGSIPQSDTLHAIAEYAGITIKELLGGAAPYANDDALSAGQLQQAILEAYPLPDGPPEQQAAYLADTVLKILALPPTRRPIHGVIANDEKGDSAKGVPPRKPTKRI